MHTQTDADHQGIHAGGEAGLFCEHSVLYQELVLTTKEYMREVRRVWCW